MKHRPGKTVVDLSPFALLDLTHHDLGDGLRVGLTAGGAHDGTDDRAHRLHIAALELLDDVRISGQSLVDGLFQRAIIGDDQIGRASCRERV